ncbi:unnamed protein product [Dibothriocephalus latus]|uniref:Uncharacterized protein n=1 Tax=Dibothriocephalus latus TaxID=60516 RepID=A0A3P7QMV1_DIBLA|nr:unnamed protein product [Dibothriocephalus latus]
MEQGHPKQNGGLSTVSEKEFLELLSSTPTRLTNSGKAKADTGSLTIEVKATTATNAEEYLQRTKRVAKSFRP